ncbi:MAG: hypothetical protein BroJett040_10290 [Oligoflexia bacterium]|nr:MAG: hypothetical protein BroJett040_10290 [Oligoflexia bacterium]
MAAKVWVVGAGKGGVGKTFFTSSLGITLSKLGFRVLLIDFDLAGANIHTSLGMPLNENNLSLYLEGKTNLNKLAQGTKIPRLSYIQGVWNEWMAHDLLKKDCKQLIEDARRLNYDFVLIDLGPGASSCHIDMFRNADEKILVTTPEPTSIEKTYRFIEALMCHELRESSTKEAYDFLLKNMKRYRSAEKTEHFSFRKYLSSHPGFSFDYFESFKQTPVRLAINCSRSRQDQDLGFSIKSVCTKYYDFPVDFIGSIDFDNAVWQSIRNREPVLIEKPFTPLAGQYLTIAKMLSTPTEVLTNLYRTAV